MRTPLQGLPSAKEAPACPDIRLGTIFQSGETYFDITLGGKEQINWHYLHKCRIRSVLLAFSQLIGARGIGRLWRSKAEDHAHRQSTSQMRIMWNNHNCSPPCEYLERRKKGGQGI